MMFNNNQHQLYEKQKTGGVSKIQFTQQQHKWDTNMAYKTRVQEIQVKFFDDQFNTPFL